MDTVLVPMTERFLQTEPRRATKSARISFLGAKISLFQHIQGVLNDRPIFNYSKQVFVNFTALDSLFFNGISWAVFNCHLKCVSDREVHKKRKTPQS
jgi:hypothetical protein